MLRRFQYRDDATIDDYLGALELGILEDETRTEERQRGLSGEGGVFGTKLGGERSTTRGVESNVRQNAASKVEKLFRLLRSSDPREIWDLDGLTDDDWACLDKGSLINLSVDITVPTVSRALAAAKDLGPLVTLMQAFTDSVEDETAQQMQRLSQYGADGGSDRYSVVAAAEGNPKYKFLCRLGKTGLLVPLEHLEGTFQLFGQIEDFLAAGQRELAVDISGMGFMNREQRRKASKKADDSTHDHFIVGPGAIVHVIALYK
ncbi:hypothetical protein Cme02nite_26350 [Catellatospora methionotrophica]|uniref:Uncharacterized protein n=1 Tax=Catellatospora methionotrophica TaxID=121620 RepID=A0A8J3L4N0_9ACTN|nr:hypothetical protein [Catellatospora methionotrophica]GIG14303.1 hypothetical protein Cme02nite_26350 [Catellatospora methionotrophica]